MLKIIIYLSLLNIFLFSENIAVIINTKNTLSSISIISLNRIYLKKIKKVDGIKLIPIDNRSLRNNFNRLVIKRKSRRVNVYWAKMVFSGNKRPPVSFKGDKDVIVAIDDSETISKISNSVNSIGYILESSLTKNVKLLRIIKN